MLNQKVFKVALVILSIACILQAFYIFLTTPNPPEPTEIISVTPLDTQIAVYEVLYDSGGATVPFIYRYFILERNIDDSEILNRIKSSSPFLVTKSSSAVQETSPDRVKLKTTDAVYEYRNIAYPKINGELKIVTLELIAEPPKLRLPLSN